MLLLGLRLIRSLPLAHPYGASSMSLDSRRLHSRRERFSNRCALKLFANVRELELRLIDSNFPVLGFATSALLRLCRTASRWRHRHATGFPRRRMARDRWPNGVRAFSSTFVSPVHAAFFIAGQQMFWPVCHRRLLHRFTKIIPLPRKNRSFFG